MRISSTSSIAWHLVCSCWAGDAVAVVLGLPAGMFVASLSDTALWNTYWAPSELVKSAANHQTLHFLFFSPVGLISIVYWKRHIFKIASSGVGPTWLPLKTQLLTFFHLFATRCIFIYLWLPIVLFCARTLAVLNFCKCCAKSMECTSLIVKTCIN